jgi:hypothetical protein
MTEIVNLNKARKARQRLDRAQTAEQNRTKFGESKASKARRQAEADRVRRTFEGHRRVEDPEPAED